MRNFFYLLICVSSVLSGFSQNEKISNDVSVLTKEDISQSQNNIWSYAKNVPKINEKKKWDFKAIENWQAMGRYLAVTNDGNFFAYSIERGGRRQYLANKPLDSLIVQSINSAWKMSFLSSERGAFTNDSKRYIFKDKDILRIIELSTGKVELVENVLSYDLAYNSQGDWLSYKLKNDDCNVILKNITSGKEKKFCGTSRNEFDKTKKWLICQANATKELVIYDLIRTIEKRFQLVDDYLLSLDGNALLLKSEEKTKKGVVVKLTYKDLMKGTSKVIFCTDSNFTEVSSFNFDNQGQQVSMITKQKYSLNEGGLSSYQIWYYKMGMDTAVSLVSNKSTDIEINFSIQGPITFTENGRYIMFYLKSLPFQIKADKGAIEVEVWNHKDLQSQSAQAYLIRQPANYLALTEVRTGKTQRLEQNERRTANIQGDFVLLKKESKKTLGDRFWDQGYGYHQDSNWLVSLRDGKSSLLPTQSGRGFFWFSPGGRYIVYFDSRDCNYYSIDLQSQRLRNISIKIPNRKLGNVGKALLRTKQKPDSYTGIAAWIENDIGLLVYDKYDIWQLDLSGKSQPVNITNGFGQKNNIVFTLMNSQRSSGQESPIPIVKKSGSFILRAFNDKTKYSGFFKVQLNVAMNPEVLSMGPYFMSEISQVHDPSLSKKGLSPVKASNADQWIVQRQSSSDGPNYFTTMDFKAFQRLTNFQPQNAYKWMRSELHTFQYLDGSRGSGILYKPENFDSSKQYPVVVIFYGNFSNNLYQFLDPALNITATTFGTSPVWLLNNGYLVFTPDIQVAPLKYGPESFNVLEGAAKYLKKLKFVKGEKIGICSHSWSAKLGAYIFTHSKSFGATVISEGFLYGNMLNVALSNDELSGTSRLETVEDGFLYGNLWTNKKSWLDQTTILNVDKSCSPLLLFCNNKSSEEYQNQTLQLFTALRRLEKSVWWLKYQKGMHTLLDSLEIQDWTTRFTQYLDHFLQNAPAPSWMTNGIPARLKGVELRYELDPSGTCGLENNKCIICNAWNEGFKRHPEMFEKPIAEWSLDKDVSAELEKKQKATRAALDIEGKKEQKKIVEILEYGYTEVNKKKAAATKKK